ncbi:MAG TPA: DNA gyrase subunit A [Phycisphaerae bacterium]|nr:DNA gyrase subunit A [Phycisphaerae bacterium]HOJ53508.1 DNA gyrase subunit A [Phycisphaerae bacterium]HOL25335.1 DNA gyrase subunit A [Phycisphaerae bacterium]HPU32168.1 DNA gyrase subunit A [Phycisphaerae bacterium]HQE41846.1 DNA gyrase subunit A [Phycisphaerae bacterium]
MSDIPTPPKNTISDRSIVEELQDSYLTYAMSVIMSRALPDARDGLKPSQRRILVAMNDLKLGPRTKPLKCAKIAGDTSGNYHPHGEAVIYPTLVRMAQDWSMRYTLVKGQGNFGSIDGDPPAAMRYTEATMAAPAHEMMADIDMETVDFEPNYDERLEEPVVLPAKFPNLLVNGTTGIAVGMATNIPPHNLREMADAIVKVIDNPHVTVEELMEVLPGPDFPTGGIICGRRGIEDAYRTGRGTITIRGKTHTEEYKGKTLIVIDEIPYQVLRSTIHDRIVECVKSGQMDDVADVRDESDRKASTRLVVELKRDANADVVLNQLYQFTPLQSNYTVMNIAVINRQPKLLNLRGMIDVYIDHRKDVIRRRTAFLLRKARQRAHIVEGLILAVGDIDAIIELIKQSPDPPTAKQRLMARGLRLDEHNAFVRMLPEAFVRRATAADQMLTGTQADAILAMQLQRLTGLEMEKLAKEYVKLSEEIEGYEAILRDEALVLDIIREDLYEMKEKYGDERRTQFAGEVTAFQMEQLIPDEQVIVTITRDGYIKRVEVDAYRRQGRGGRGVKGSDTKDGDFLEHLFAASTHDYLLFFTNRGRVYWLKVYDIPAMSRTSRGRAIANLIKMLPNETHKAVLAVRAFEERFVFFATAKGVVKKTPLAAFSRPRSDGIIAMSLDPDDELIGVGQTSGEDEIVLGTRNGMAVRFDEVDVRAMGRQAHGVKGIELREGDVVVDMVVTNEDASLLTVCENGYGKRTRVGEYRKTRRGGKGVINIKTTERNGKVVALKSVTDTDELMLISAKGICLRTGLGELREIGRATQGVRLMRVEEDDKVVAVAKIAPEEDEETTEANGTNGANGSDSTSAQADNGTNGSEGASTSATSDAAAEDANGTAVTDAGQETPAQPDEEATDSPDNEGQDSESNGDPTA